MRIGHGIAMFGAGLVVLGALFMPWQSFELAELTAAGWAVPTGQVLGTLALLVVLSAAFGALGTMARRLATVNLILAVFAIAWVLAAYVSRGSWFTSQPGEVILMASGYSTACWGVAGMFLGALVSLASEPHAPAGRPVLRVAMLWGDTVIDERELLAPGQITLGEQADDDLVAEVSAALGMHFPLFKATENGYAMGLHKSLHGDVVLGRSGERMALEAFLGDSAETEDANGVPFRELQAGDWGMVELQGGVRVVFQFVEPYADRKGVRRWGWLAFDESVTAAIAASAVVQVLFIVWAVLSWQEHPVRLIHTNTSQAMHVNASLHVPEEVVQLEQEAPVDEEPSKAAGGESGTFGDPDETPEKVTKLKKSKGALVQRKPPRTLNDIVNRSITSKAGPIAAVFGKPTTAFETRFAIATRGGEQMELGGGTHRAMGFKGIGDGGDGHGDGQLLGAGWDQGNDLGEVRQRVRLGKKPKRRGVPVRMGPLSPPVGHCSKSGIRKKVRRRVRAIRACYERRLLAKPRLKGKLSLRWTIGTEGKVTAVGGSGSLKDSTTVNCIKRVIRRIRFAKPETGFCVVKWPFVFDPGLR